MAILLGASGYSPDRADSGEVDWMIAELLRAARNGQKSFLNPAPLEGTAQHRKSPAASRSRTAQCPGPIQRSTVNNSFGRSTAAIHRQSRELSGNNHNFGSN